jgi:ADP-ribosylglycohydrolase
MFYAPWHCWSFNNNKEGRWMTQLSLFDEPSKGRSPRPDTPSLERYLAAALYSAIGDALGWPTEFLPSPGKGQLEFALPLESFVRWKKLVGGKWWGYEDEIQPGEYSDDTQLTLAVARCINEEGRFEPERFAYEELPLWLQYERGGGRTVKTAARKLVARRASWLNNFYRQGDLDYRQAGANGAAMRNLPIALVNVHDKQALIRDSFSNAIITHGHPRAILGTILFGLAIHCALTLAAPPPPASFIECILDGLRHVPQVMRNDERLSHWVQSWNRGLLSREDSFAHLYRATLQETVHYLKEIPAFLERDPRDYYAFVGALDPSTKGSGIATVCVAIFLFLKYLHKPLNGLLTAVNAYGSDTDTIALFVGALLGAYHGLNALPANLLEGIQDQTMLMETARRLYDIASGTNPYVLISFSSGEKEISYRSIMQWEIGLHQMFWGIYKDGDDIIHPSLGRGTITDQTEKPLRKDGYVAKLIRVHFDSGQSCVFHSRVKDQESVLTSLAEEVARALQQ